MKTLIRICFVFAVVLSSLNIGSAQTRKEKQAAKAEAVKKMVDESTYVFMANFANPLRGGTKTLTSSDYDLKVSKDTIIAYLPYYGQAYIAPTDPTEGGIKFTCTNFEYTSKQKKNGNWEIVIKPKDKNISDMRDVQQMRLNITTDGYASLQVISSNRDEISFDGELKMKSLN